MRTEARQLNIALYSIENAYLSNEKKRRMSRAELNILYALGDGEPHSQVEIIREWLVPKTTVNTIIKRWERAGYVIQKSIPGKRREMQILLTETGQEYANEIMTPLYRAEDIALTKTIERYSARFVEMVEYFGAAFSEAVEAEDGRQ